MREPLYVEISPLLSPQHTGISRFGARLIEALARRTTLRLMTTSRRRAPWFGGPRTSLVFGEDIEVARGALRRADGNLDRWIRDLWRRPRVRHDADRSRRSACLYLLFRPEVRHFSREVTVLHDLTPLLMPHVHEEWTCQTFGRFFARALPLSDAAIAVSESTKADASWLCPLAPAQIAVAHPGPSLCVDAHASRLAVERRRDLIVVVATREPRKNARLLLDWFFDADSVPAGAELCWVGPRGWLWDASELRSRRGGDGRRFRFAGTVSDASLCEIYRRAAFTIYPSLYEGFGFPVLDSLLHGAPVACSFNSSLKEFAGPGVYYFDPCDPASLETAVGELLAGPAGFDRADLHRRCSWERAADTVMELCAI